MAKVLVTGGAGFIGKHVVAALLQRGHDVVVLDNLSAVGTQDYRAPKGAVFQQTDVLNAAVLREALQGCTDVVHLAGQTDVTHSLQNPQQTFATNVIGTELVLSLAKDMGLTGRVLLASSAAVYGNVPTLPVKELDAAGQVPLSPYGTSKAMNELQAKGWQVAFGLPTLSLRFFNVFGPGQHQTNPTAGIVTKMVTCIETGELLTIYGDGTQKRDYVAVTDVALVMAKLLDLPVNKLAEIPPVLNVASGTATTLNDLLRHIAGVMGRNPKLEYRSARTGEIKDSWADISALRAVLPDWQPQSLQAGLRAWLAKPPTA